MYHITDMTAPFPGQLGSSWLVGCKIQGFTGGDGGWNHKLANCWNADDLTELAEVINICLAVPKYHAKFCTKYNKDIYMAHFNCKLYHVALRGTSSTTAATTYMICGPSAAIATDGSMWTFAWRPKIRRNWVGSSFCQHTNETRVRTWHHLT